MTRSIMRPAMSGTAVLLLLLVSGPEAQDGPVGTWQRAEADGTTTRVRLDDDGAATLSGRSVASLADVEGLQDTEGLPDTLTVVLEASGTWRLEAGQLRLTLSERRLLIDGRPFEEALDTLAVVLARSLAVELELPEEGVANLAVLVRAGLDAEYDEQAFLDESLSDLDGLLLYRLDGDVLWLTGADGVVTRWERVVDSAVAPASWGEVKRWKRE